MGEYEREERGRAESRVGGWGHEYMGPRGSPRPLIPPLRRMFEAHLGVVAPGLVRRVGAGSRGGLGSPAVS